MNSLAHDFAREGVACVRGVLDGRGITFAEQAFTWSLEHPGPGAREVLAGRPGAFFQDHSNPEAFPHYLPLICETGLAGSVADILGSDNLWLLYEQIWLKDGGERRATPWHQDLPYLPLAGDHIATVWLNLDPIAEADSLQFVRGSHRGPLYNPTAFDASDPSAAMYEDGVWPPLPDIESDRSAWDIVAWGVAPGDVVIFHPAILHGGAGTRAGERRRSISLRFIGDDAFVADRPEAGLADVDRLKANRDDLDPMQQLALEPPGSLFRHSAFPKVW